MNVNKVKQSVQNQMQFAGIDVHLMDRKINRSLLELQLGNEYRKDKLISRFSLLDDEDLVEIPNSYQNNAEYLVNDLYLKGKYRYEIGVFSLIGKLDFHQLHGVLKNHENTIRQSPFFCVRI
jgi:hypothetical protein